MGSCNCHLKVQYYCSESSISSISLFFFFNILRSFYNLIQHQLCSVVIVTVFSQNSNRLLLTAQ